MPSAIVIKPSQLAGTLRAEARFVRGAMRRGAGRAARRGKVLLIERANAAGKTYLGQFRSSFHVAEVGNTVTLYNDAPHAGIIELGARPHPVSEEGRAAIKRWVLRKLSVTDEAEADRITRAICWKLKHHGQKGTYLFRDAQPDLARFYAEAVKDILAERRGRKKDGAP